MSTLLPGQVEETSTVASSVPQPSNHGETSQATGTGETSEAAVGACGSERRKSISALDRAAGAEFGRQMDELLASDPFE